MPANSAKRKIYPLAIADSMWTLPYLSLGMVTAYLRSYKDGLIAQNYSIGNIQLGGIDEFPIEDLHQQIICQHAPVCLFSSYVWNHHRNLQVAQKIKSDNPSALIIFGGPEVPKYEGETESFLEDNLFIDITVLGEGEVSCAEILEKLAVADRWVLDGINEVQGIVFRDGNEIIRTASRDRLQNISELPSPYLTGEFEPWFREFPNTILETNRGCPYGCTYCDWGSATLQKVMRFDPARVKAEIEYIASKKSKAIFIADANFGMLEQDIEIAEALVATKARLGYPKRLYTNFAKNGGRRLMAVIKILHEGGLLPVGIVALQTIDETTLKAIKRDNIKTSAYEKMMEYFNAENIPMASDLMIGLPGQTVDSLQRDMQYCFDWKVSANGNYTSLMPNAPMAEADYRQQHLIVTDAAGMVVSTTSFTESDMQYMKSLFLTYQFHVRLGILKYYLYYLQGEHGIAAIELLRKWLDAVLARDERMPLSCRLHSEVLRAESRSGDWALLSWQDEANFFFQDIDNYYREFHRFAQQAYNFKSEEAVFDVLLEAQAATMPRLGRDYPHEVQLAHDITSYFRQYKQVANVNRLAGTLRSLDQFKPACLEITAGSWQPSSLSFHKLEIDGHADAWELPSALRFY